MAFIERVECGESIPLSIEDTGFKLFKVTCKQFGEKNGKLRATFGCHLLWQFFCNHLKIRYPYKKERCFGMFTD